MNTKLLTDIYHQLSAFRSTSVTPSEFKKIRNLKDSGKWIIDDEESRAVSIVLDMLKDCGADESGLSL